MDQPLANAAAHATHPIIGNAGLIVFSLMMLIAGVAFVYAIIMRYRQLIMGKRPDVRWDQMPARVLNVFIYVIGQARLPKNGYLYSGILHIFIFGAFMVLSVDTINFVTDGGFKAYAVATGTPLAELWNGGDFHLPFTELPDFYQAIADTFRFLCQSHYSMASS